MLFGIGFVVPDVWKKCWPILMVYATHHALAKCALFLSVGVVTSEVKSQFFRVLRRMAICIPALAVIGFPFTSGAFAKGSMKYLVKKLADTYEWGSVLIMILLISAFATTLILSRYLYLVWPRRSKLSGATPPERGVYMTWALMVVIVLALPFLIHAQEFITLSQKVNHYALKFSSIWVLLLAAGVACVAIKIKFQLPWSIPAGDILKVYNAIYRAFRQVVAAAVDVIMQI